ncbi:DUF3997 domain-containing protein [Lentibacillus cibarius]|nr:DUF3997 domain-containing protein [Lentibacillus cibarius]
MSFILTSCAGLGDYSIDLPGNLQVDRINGENIVISLIDDASGSGTTIVPAKVAEVGWNKKYIIVRQTDQKEGFWVVKVDTAKAIGPLDHKNFLKKKKELNIPSEVELKSLDYYTKEM